MALRTLAVLIGMAGIVYAWQELGGWAALLSAVLFVTAAVRGDRRSSSRAGAATPPADTPKD